jgi:hypothetical protein
MFKRLKCWLTEHNFKFEGFSYSSYTNHNWYGGFSGGGGSLGRNYKCTKCNKKIWRYGGGKELQTFLTKEYK